MTKAKAPPSEADRRKKKLQEIHTHVEVLKSALHDLALMLAEVPPHPDPLVWPFTADPDEQVIAKKRLIDLAEIAHAVGVASDRLLVVDTKAIVSNLREEFFRSGLTSIDGRTRPAGRDGATRAKEHLIAGLQAVANETLERHELVSKLAQQLERWFSMELPGGAGPAKLTQGMKAARNPVKREQVLERALKSMAPSDLRDPEKVVRVVWLALGADAKRVKNLFSYRDHRAL